MTSQTRSALVTHFALANNSADCAAKEANQDRGIGDSDVIFITK
jgi:hypothetical protein